MADARSARKAAEKAARDLIGGPLIAAVGDLGEAVTAQQDAAAVVATAQTRAAELVAAAKRDGASLVAAARGDVDAADQAYSAAHTKALDAGWAPKALTDLGYPTPSKRTRAERTPAAATADPTTPTSVTDDTAGSDVAAAVDDATHAATLGDAVTS